MTNFKNTSLLFICAFCLPFALCRPAVSAAPLKVVSVEPGGGTPADMPLLYAIKEGCLARQGISVEWIKVLKGATAVLASGQADLSMTTLTPVMMAHQSGADFKVLAFLYKSFDHYAVSRYPAAEASKIKTIALNPSSAVNETYLKSFLDHLGLDRKNLKTVYALGDTPKYAMLEMGYADFFAINSAELARQIAAEKKYYLIQDPYLGRNTSARVITASSKALKKKGSDVEKFVAAIYCAVNGLAAEHEKTVALLMAEYKYSREEAETYYKTLTEAVKGLDYVPSPRRLEPEWEYIPDVKPEDRKKADGLMFPDFAAKAVAGIPATQIK